VPRFIFFRCYRNCLLAYLTVLLTFFLTYLLPYLSNPLRIGPFYFQAGGRKRRPNLEVVFLCRFCVVYYVLLWMYASFRFV